jgi:hypothetical protein
MGGEILFRVSGWAAWMPGRETESAWLRWAGADADTEEAPTAKVPLNLRRRVSPLGQAALRCAWNLPDASRARMVFASRHGEFGRTLSILDAIAAHAEVSPADFTLSVHHALAGLLSIAQSNRHGHTAVAAGSESFGFGLMEAVTSLVEHPAEPLPAPYDHFTTGLDNPLALALSLGPADAGEGISLTISPSNGEQRTDTALDFLRFMLTGAREMIARGERLHWRWGRYAAAA